MIYIDTGAFIAKYLSRDQHHKSAIKKWQKIEKSRQKCVTSNFVIDETLTLLGRWANYEFAAEKAKLIYGSHQLSILRPDLEDELSALKFFEKFADQKVSFTDCISFSLMTKKRIKHVFSFDKHFRRAGFTLF